ncbi:hypothetical protein [Sulfurirhabdus autotrophica]|uniref:Uncharacterized protein n=1 Tax=Sulfurirhabdus autotrophica TaxID=1706046 RepID=A0A4V2W1X1_9PROT|nr:hypothetical protein [Sulfurirhabdus autotrophica]TCV85869.1 hypothetical protein EDC63_10877 [Sulfurirhabdus autotrophica]
MTTDKINPNSMHVPDWWMPDLKQRFESGEEWAIMQVIHTCASKGWALPDWAALAYISAFEKIQKSDEKSWDDVFGKRHKKGTNLNATNKKKRIMWPLFGHVQHIIEHSPETPIDNEFFEQVGSKFAIGKTLASKYYYEAKKNAELC